MIKSLTMKLDVLKCQCGEIQMRDVKRLYYTCSNCGTTTSRTGKVLVQGRKVLNEVK